MKRLNINVFSLAGSRVGVNHTLSIVQHFRAGGRKPTHMRVWRFRARFRRDRCVSSPCAAQSATAGSQPHSARLRSKLTLERLVRRKQRRRSLHRRRQRRPRPHPAEAPVTVPVQVYATIAALTHPMTIDADRARGRTGAATRLLLGPEAARLGYDLSQTSSSSRVPAAVHAMLDFGLFGDEDKELVLHRLHRRRARHQSKGRPGLIPRMFPMPRSRR